MSPAERPKYRTDQAEMRADVWDACDKTCHYCGIELHPLRNFAVDHVIPRCAGGDDDPSNLVAACRTCNQRKGTTTDRLLCNRLNRGGAGQTKGYAIRSDLVLAYQERHGLTRPEFARRVGVAPGLVREAEEGRYLHLSLIVLFARAMDLDYMELLRDADCLRERLEVDADELARLRDLARTRPSGVWVRGPEMEPDEKYAERELREARQEWSC